MNSEQSPVCIDLHCHSSFSDDGEYSPEQLAERLAAVGVQAAALTDHETTRGLDRFQVALEQYGIQFIAGAEIEVHFEDVTIHLLVYGVSPQDREFQAYLASIRDPLRSSVLKLVNRFRRLKKQTRSAHFKNGHTDAARAIELAHRSGASVYLAHPLDSIPDMHRLEQALTALTRQKLDGIEAYYKPYQPETQAELAALAARHGLLKSGGSDYHGERVSFGTQPGMCMPAEAWHLFLDDLKMKAKAHAADQ